MAESLLLLVKDRVAFMLTGGEHVTHVSLPVSKFLRLKENNDLVQIYALLLDYIKAYSLRKRCGVSLSRDSSILLELASSGVKIVMV